MIADLIRVEIEAMIDPAKWRKREAAETTQSRAAGPGLEKLGQGQKGGGAMINHHQGKIWKTDSTRSTARSWS